MMIDIAVPRDIDPRVGEVDGIHLFDWMIWKQVVKKRRPRDGEYSADAANKIVADEVAGFPPRAAWPSE